MKKKILVIVHAPYGACELYRLLYPYKWIKENSDLDIEVLTVARDTTFDEDQLKDVALVIFHKGFVNHKSISQLKQMNIKTMIDYDDHIMLPKNHLLYDKYKELKISEVLFVCLTLADYVTVATKRLHTLFKRIKEVKVFPNVIPDNLTDCKVNKTQSDKLRIGYFGGKTHKHDISILRNICKDIHYSFKDKVEFHLFGCDDDHITKYNINTLTDNGKYKDMLVVHEKVNLDEYFPLYNLIDVAIAPLEENEFNKAKSELKFLEATKMNTLFIGSDILTYNKVVKHKENGFLFKKKSDFIKIISDILEDKWYAYGENLDRDRILKNANITLQEHFNFEKVQRERIEWLKEIIK